MSFRSLVDGQESRQIDIRDRGLAYGDGLFETLRIVSGSALRLPLHLARLSRGCERLQIQLDTADVLADIEQILASDSADGVLKIIITRAFQQRGYGFNRPSPARRYVQFQPHEDSASRQWHAGVTLRVCSHRLPVNPALAGIKHLNRLDNVLARAEWNDADVHEGIMLDSEGHVVEGTMSNLFIERDQALLTPSLHRCGVAGVMRQWIMESQAPALGVTVRQVDLSLRDIIAAPAAFICNSLIGICPVVAVRGGGSGPVALSPGPITLRLQAAIGEGT